MDHKLHDFGTEASSKKENCSFIYQLSNAMLEKRLKVTDIESGRRAAEISRKERITTETEK